MKAVFKTLNEIGYNFNNQIVKAFRSFRYYIFFRMENLLLLCLLIIRIFSYVMIPIQKLKSNLKESQNWETTFRQEIKLYL